MAGNLELIKNATSSSNVSNVDLTNVFSADYDVSILMTVLVLLLHKCK